MRAWRVSAPRASQNGDRVVTSGSASRPAAKYYLGGTTYYTHIVSLVAIVTSLDRTTEIVRFRRFTLQLTFRAALKA